MLISLWIRIFKHFTIIVQEIQFKSKYYKAWWDDEYVWWKKNYTHYQMHFVILMHSTEFDARSKP